MHRRAIYMLVIGIQLMNAAHSSPITYRLAITETGKPSSWDPLEADNTQNLILARMVYAQLFEINEKNELRSRIFTHFEYNDTKRVITVSLSNKVRYSDGTAITTQDVVLCIQRMLLKRPTFPVIEFIEGKEEWLRKTSPLLSLPAGIVVAGNDISIRLKQPVKHPLFRLSLELFSVIPQNRVDLVKNELKAGNIPSSGHYVQASETADEITFKLRTDIDELELKRENFPTTISLIFPPIKTPIALLALMDDRTAILSSEALFTPKDLAALKNKSYFNKILGVRFGSYLMNSMNAPFAAKVNRDHFSQQFYNAVQEVLIGDSPTRSRSLLPEIVPGYLSDSELQLSDDKSLPSGKTTVTVGKLSFAVHGVFYQALEKMKPDFVEIKFKSDYLNREDMEQDFKKGVIDIIPLSSGFWPLDPVNDMKMFFAPNMHQDLFILQQDKKLQTLIEQAKNEKDPKSTLRKINKHLYEKKDINVFMNFNRFIMSKQNSGLEKMQSSMLIPSPWRIFKNFKR